MQKMIRFLSWLLLSLSLAACGSKEDASDKSNAEKKTAKPPLVTTAQVKPQAVENIEEAFGTLEALDNPTISAEVPGRVIKIHVNTGEEVKKGQLIATLNSSDFAAQTAEAEAEVARIEALLSNQVKTVERNQVLVGKNFISQNAIDNDIAQQSALKEQLLGASARLAAIHHNSSKTKIYAPAGGNVEKKLTDEGNFVKIGDPILMIVSKKHLRAHLSFPEYIATKLKPGLEVRLKSPTSELVVKSVIHELKPMIIEGSRSVDVIADIIGAPNWQAGASVKAEVILGKKSAALMVPEQSLVLRPAGEVVYVVRNGKAFQALVKTGLHQNGMVEISSGLNENDTIVVDGAGFLTHDVNIRTAQSTAQKTP